MIKSTARRYKDRILRERVKSERTETAADFSHHPYAREETEAKRLDRNYSELLQELRVAEAGVQILFAFLLALAFTQRSPGCRSSSETRTWRRCCGQPPPADC